MPRKSRQKSALHSSVAGLFALVMAGLVASAASAAPDSPGQVQRKIVQDLAEAVNADGGLKRTAHDLLEEAGLAQESGIASLPPIPDVPRSDDPAFETFDMRLVFGMLAQAFGYVGNQDVMRAQGENSHKALQLRSGTATLLDLSDHIAQTPHGPTLTTPLIIWNDATLHLGRGETLALGRAHGAFIINFGTLLVDGAEIYSDEVENPYNARFRPFVLTTGPGIFRARNARFSYLGFGPTQKFAGVSIARNALERPTAPSYIVKSVLEHLHSLSIHVSDGTIIAENRIVDAEKAALIVARSRDTKVLDNIVSGTARTNAIRILDGSVRTFMAGNVVLGGDRAGILIKGASNHSILRNNIVWNRKGGGIKVDRVRCVQLIGNTLIDNQQKGIEVRQSREALLSGNMLASNRSSGIWISGQPSDAVTRIEDNILDANGAGIATATAEALIFDGNDFSHQFPQFFAGDIVAQARYVAADIKGKTPIALSAAGPVSIPNYPSQCGYGG